MNKSVFRAFLTLCLAVLCVTACEWFNAVDDGKIPQGVIFYTGCPVVFYFVDEDGGDLVDTDQPSTYPTVFRVPAYEDDRDKARQSIQTIHQSGVDYYVYNEGSNWLWEDSDTQRIAFQTYMWGKTVNPDAKLFVYYKQYTEPDSLQVTYKYVTADDDPALQGSWGVDVTSLKYNGVEVLVGNENGKVFIRKPSHGETTVKVGSLD